MFEVRLQLFNHLTVLVSYLVDVLMAVSGVGLPLRLGNDITWPPV